MKTIEIRDFSVRRGTFTLGPLSLTLQPGEIFAVLGYTGSGKTVLLESLCGLIPGNSGKILYDGRDVLDIPIGQRGLGIVSQDHGLFPHMRVEENIAYGLRRNHYKREEREQRVSELLHLLSISHIRKQYPGTLSGGESQRTALARALALKPELLVLDEPFSALDPATRQTLYRELLAIHKQLPCTIVFVTHDFAEAQLLADRVGILLDGELLTVSDSKTLMERHYCDKIEKFLGRL